MKLLLATNNKNKVHEFCTLLQSEGVEILSKSDVGLTSDVEETGATFAENAYIKAMAAMQATGLPSIADDSGLSVDSLDGKPGVLSARYTGNHDDSDRDRYELLLKNMNGIEDRCARFVCAICCVFPNGDVISVEGTCKGIIVFEPRGENGFGYDPVFCADGMEKTMAELSMAEKNRISHRGNALRSFLFEWRKYHADRQAACTIEETGI